MDFAIGGWRQDLSRTKPRLTVESAILRFPQVSGSLLIKVVRIPVV